jgi:glycosyltransferase involved in cell wall biosynthesis
VESKDMKIAFTGSVLQPSWPGGEPVISHLLEDAFSSQGIEISKFFVPRYKPVKWNLNPLTSQSITNRRVISIYKSHIDKIKPDLVMNWFDYDLSAFWASVLAKRPTIVQAQILWPVCPSSCLFNEITESPCKGSNIACGLCLAKRAKVVGEVRVPSIACLPFTQLSTFRTNNMRSKLRHASAIVSDNYFLKTVMANLHFDVSKVRVIYNGVDFNKIKPAISFKKPKTVLFLSYRIKREKGYHHFVWVSKNLKPLFPDVRFLWVGQTDMRGDSFETQGYVWDKAALEDIFRSSYILLLPSLWPEPMSYAVIQAMSYGKPVVAYDVGANSEGIIHGKTGLLAEWGNVSQLSSYVAALLADEKLAVTMGQNARKQAEEMFGLDNMIKNYKALVSQVAP